MDAVYDGVRQRFASSTAVRIIRERSESVLPTLETGSLDWVYIDGDHTCEAVLTDLRLCLPNMKPHGIIAGTTTPPAHIRFGVQSSNSSASTV